MPSTVAIQERFKHLWFKIWTNLQASLFEPQWTSCNHIVPNDIFPFPPTDLWCCLVGLEQQSRSGLEESPQLDLVLPADGELAVAQGEDLIDGTITQQIVLQFLWNPIKC